MMRNLDRTHPGDLVTTHEFGGPLLEDSFTHMSGDCCQLSVGGLSPSPYRTFHVVSLCGFTWVSSPLADWLVQSECPQKGELEEAV